ncbi:unnamed protein product [Caenorhabditis auriculariae]|uniref:VWFA domain-containing protein n=1 Tax=Caenorhabditis auriculariae TaxID=2777116 RepID=A0A8S1GRN4_9PELO|nr:unnamed protein product [Caenorhabditis auriculariae]
MQQLRTWFQLLVLVALAYAASKSCVASNCASTSLEADFVFLVDASDSIGAANFAALQIFLVDFVKGLTLSSVDSQIALYTYGVSAVNYLTLSAGNTPTAVQNAITAMKYEGSSSRNLYQALTKQQTDVNPMSGLRTSTYKKVLVILAGDAFTGNAVVGSSILTQVQQKYDTILSVGVGPKALANLAATLPKLSTYSTNAFFALSIDQLPYVGSWIGTYSCNGIQQTTVIPMTTPPPTQSPSVPCQLSTLNYDVYLILDVSATASAADFAAMKQAVKNFVAPFPIGDGKTQFALVATSVDSQIYYTAFHSGQKRDDVNGAIDKLLQDTNVGQTMNLALGAIQGYLNQHYATSNKIIAYFTSNTNWDSSPVTTINNLKTTFGVSPVAVQWTSTASATDLASFAGSANCVNAVANKANTATWLQTKMCSKTFC